MLRRLVAIYMTFVLVAGQSLCCCTTVYAAHASKSATAGPASSSPDRTPPCCCKDAPSEKAAGVSCHSPGGSDESQPAPKPGKHQCPCKDKGGKLTLDSNSASSATAQDALRLLTSAFQYVLVAFTADLSADPTPDSGGPAPPGQRLTSWRLLNAPHMLRC
jgi:hypothetical protein